MSRRGRAATSSRNQFNPTFLGEFEDLSLRILKGNFTQKHQVVGRADTATASNGGFGGGGYNAWFQVELKVPAWIILTKGGPRPKYIQVSVYDQNKNPKEGRMIFQAEQPPVQEVQFLSSNVFTAQQRRVKTAEEELALRSFGNRLNVNNTFNYYPFFGHVSSSNADLYNFFNQSRVDKGDDMFYPLTRGKYLICISSTRNEPLDYEVGLVIEPEDDEVFILCEDILIVNVGLENSLDVPTSFEIPSPITTNVTVPSGSNAYTYALAQVNSTATVTVESPAEWLISTVPSGQSYPEDVLLGEFNPGYLDSFHDHSYSEWQAAWQRDNRYNDSLPELFVPLLNRR